MSRNNAKTNAPDKNLKLKTGHPVSVIFFSCCVRDPVNRRTAMLRLNLDPNPISHPKSNPKCYPKLKLSFKFFLEYAKL